jgi:hypothetical protein
VAKIDCEIFGGADDEAKLFEIAENAHRVELTALEKAEQIAEWVRLKEKQVAPPRRGCSTLVFSQLARRAT